LIHNGFTTPLVVVRGGGDLATGTARRLFLAGFRVLVTEREQPWCVRRLTSFATAVHEGEITVEGVTARRIENIDDWDDVGVFVCPDRPCPDGSPVDVLVDARVLKHGHDTRIDHAPIVIGVGPGFEVGRDCHAAVETERGHDLGRVLYRGRTRKFSGRPAQVDGVGGERVLRSPADGVFLATSSIGNRVTAGTPICEVAGTPVSARIPGVLRGLIADGTEVRSGQKIGDIDPRCDQSSCHTISDKANAVGGGVVEAVLVLLRRPDQ
jgi:xanthine dehydrogenase accessory factor